jgi:hypothetical protein
MLLTGVGTAPGTGLIIGGAALTIWDTVEGFNQAFEAGRKIGLDLLKKRLESVGGDVDFAREHGLIPDNETLLKLGVTQKQLVEFGLAESELLQNEEEPTVGTEQILEENEPYVDTKSDSQ